MEEDKGTHIDNDKEKVSDNKEKSKKKSKKKHPFLRFLKWLLIIIIILIVILAAVGLAYVNSMLGETQKQDIDENSIGISKETEDKLSNYRNIALFGIDTRGNNYQEGNRSDTIMIASINKKTNEIKLISVYRDTYMLCNNHGKEMLTKITHAYSYGGAQNAVLALNTNMDLNIKEYVTVNFSAVAAAVDALGGIDIDIDSEEIKYINGYIDETSKVYGKQSSHITTAGKKHLDGVQAVAYSRIRYTAGGDYKRAERQRIVLDAMIAKAKTKSISELQKLANTILPKVSTNLSNTEIMSLIVKLMNANISTQEGWPYTTKGITLDAWYGIPETLESNVVNLHKKIFDDANYVASDEVKSISKQIEDKTGYHEVSKEEN